MKTAEARKYIEYATVAGFLSGAVSLLFMLQQVLAKVHGAWWLTLDIVIVFGLSYGIHRKSRAAATLMLAYFVSNRLLMWRVWTGGKMLPIVIVFGFLFLQAARATFYLHRISQEE